MYDVDCTLGIAAFFLCVCVRVCVRAWTFAGRYYFAGLFAEFAGLSPASFGPARNSTKGTERGTHDRLGAIVTYLLHKSRGTRDRLGALVTNRAGP